MDYPVIVHLRQGNWRKLSHIILVLFFKMSRYDLAADYQSENNELSVTFMWYLELLIALEPICCRFVHLISNLRKTHIDPKSHVTSYQHLCELM